MSTTPTAIVFWSAGRANGFPGCRSCGIATAPISASICRAARSLPEGRSLADLALDGDGDRPSAHRLIDDAG
jgi:hypothetical protein